MQFLLAVDMGVKTGLALYGNDGSLRWYRSQNFGNAARLRRGVKSILFELDDLSWVVIEGGGPLADIWQNEAQRRQIQTVQISAETWRQQLFYARDQRSSAAATSSVLAHPRSTRLMVGRAACAATAPARPVHPPWAR